MTRSGAREQLADHLLRDSNLKEGDWLLGVGQATGTSLAAATEALRLGARVCLLQLDGGTGERTSRFRSARSDPHRLAYGDDVFRGAVFDGVLQQLGSPVIAFREARRALRPGGTLWVVTWSREQIQGAGWQRCFPEVEAGALRHLPDVPEVAWMLEVAGYDHVRTEKYAWDAALPRVRGSGEDEDIAAGSRGALTVLRGKVPIPGLATLDIA